MLSAAIAAGPFSGSRDVLVERPLEQIEHVKNENLLSKNFLRRPVHVENSSRRDQCADDRHAIELGQGFRACAPATAPR